MKITDSTANPKRAGFMVNPLQTVDGTIVTGGSSSRLTIR
jgi:hypothetical protein